MTTLPTQGKIDQVSALRAKLEQCSIAVTADYTGIPTNEITELRRRMRATGIEFTVVKNTLVNLAADAAQRPQFKQIVQGPTAIAFGYGDPQDAARALSDYLRTSRSALALRGAVLGDGAPLSPAEVHRLATLPGRPQLVASLLGQLQAPIQHLLLVLNGPLRSLDAVLQARLRQLEATGPGGLPALE